MFKEYADRQIDFPEIVIKNNCKRGYFMIENDNFGFEFFKSKYKY